MTEPLYESRGFGGFALDEISRVFGKDRETLRVEWSSRQRHNVALVADNSAHRWFLKQLGEPLLEGPLSLARENLFHTCLKAGDLPKKLGHYTAPLLERRGDGSLLIFEGFAERLALREAFLNVGRDIQKDAFHVGTMLSILHDPNNLRDNSFEAVKHPIQTFGRLSPEILGNAPGAFSGLLRWTQKDPAVNVRLRKLREKWNPASLIHGDLKIDNVLVPKKPSAKTPPIVVDWELAGKGDPSWDCGSFIGSLCFLLLEALRPDTPEAKHLKNNSIVLGAIRSFCAGYQGTGSASRPPPGLEDAFQWAGYWLLQRVSMMLPLNRSLSPLCLSALSLSTELLLETDFEKSLTGAAV